MCEHTFEEGVAASKGCCSAFALGLLAVDVPDHHVGILVDACELGARDTPQDVLEQRTPMYVKPQKRIEGCMGEKDI